MRRLPIPIAVVLAGLWLAAVALAAFNQTAAITLTTHTAGRSTGIVATLRSSDPTAPGAKPKSAAQGRDHLSPGARRSICARPW